MVHGVSKKYNYKEMQQSGLEELALIRCQGCLPVPIQDQPFSYTYVQYSKLLLVCLIYLQSIQNLQSMTCTQAFHALHSAFQVPKKTTTPRSDRARLRMH